jgi:competence protein ComEC
MILIAISCAWVLGIFLGSIYHFPLVLIFTGLIPLPFIFFFKESRKHLALVALCLFAFFGAAFYYPTTVSQDSRVAAFNNLGLVEIKGTIDASPDVRDNTTHIELAVQEIKIDSNWEQVNGKILLFVPRYPEYRYGDILLIKGKLENAPEFEGFDYQTYLSRQDIYSTMLNPGIEIFSRNESTLSFGSIYTLRDRLSQVLVSVLPEPHASLAQGIVLGIRSSIPDDLQANLSITGTAHLLAISGINLSIIAGIMVAIGLWIFGRRYYLYVWLALFAIWFYSLITGMQAPVIRGAIMASLFLIAELLGRQKSAIVALSFSAAIMVGIDPQLLWSISFQLTFLAMVGLIFITPLVQNLTRQGIALRLDPDGSGAKTATMVSDSLSVTLGALIAVWPIIAYNFGIISLVGPLSTFLIGPVLPLIIIFGSLTAVIGLLSLPLASVFGWIVWIFLSYMLWLVNAFAALPTAAINTNSININFAWVYYLLFGLAVFIIANSRKVGKLLSGLTGKLKPGLTRGSELYVAVPKKWVIIPLLVIAFLTSFTAVTLPDKDLHVSILDVGEGDSIFIKTGNQNILIDGGPSPQAACTGLSSKLPFWDRNIDLMVLTHPHLDHMSGLIEILQRYQVRQILAPNLNSDSPAYQEWLNLINTKNIHYTLASAGQQITLEDGATLEILNPLNNSPGDTESDLENDGIVARLSLNKVSFLFTADIEQEGEAQLISRRANLSCSILKVAHHGSSTSTGSDFLNVAKPQLAVISVGADNTFGHPSEDTLSRLTELVGAGNLYRTDTSGTIEFTTDGQLLWVKTAR